MTATRQIAMYLSQCRNALTGKRFDRSPIRSRYHDAMMAAHHRDRPPVLVVELYRTTVAKLARTCLALAKRAGDGLALRAGGRQAPSAAAGDREHGPVRFRATCLRQRWRCHGQEE